MSKLVIVESPAKAKTIKKYLGSGYEVIASMGHVRDLPQARLCVDVKNDFAPKYAIIKGKEKLVSELKAAAQDADTVYLATDPDREGEAISWHLAYILGLDAGDMNRVTFNEITKTGVTEGMANPRTIDLDEISDSNFSSFPSSFTSATLISSGCAVSINKRFFIPKLSFSLIADTCGFYLNIKTSLPTATRLTILSIKTSVSKFLGYS